MRSRAEPSFEKRWCRGERGGTATKLTVKKKLSTRLHICACETNAMSDAKVAIVSSDEDARPWCS